jgi:hypothetical protein
MAVTPVTIDLSAETAALPQETETNVAVVGTAANAPPEAAFGEVNRYTSSADVSNDYGEGSDVHIASQAIEEMGASEWHVQVLEETEVVDEDVADGAALANAPALGEAGVTAANRDVVYSVADPPAQPDAGEVAVNTATGTVTTDDGTNATLTYSYVDWTELERLEPKDINRAYLADRQAGREHIGSYDELLSWAAGADVGVPLAIDDLRNYADDETGMGVAHDVAGYVPSGNAIGIAHKSSADVGAYVLGQLAVNDPWFNPYFDGDGYPFASEKIDERLVGDPGDTGTFLGGDNDGNGPVNVIASVSGVNVMYQSVSTAGAASSYQFFDVKMTEMFAAQVIENALTSLKLREDRVPFTSDGRTMIRSTINGALAAYEGGPTDPFAETNVYVPPIDELSDDDIANRKWTGITVDGQLSGDAHEFDLELTVSA